MGLWRRSLTCLALVYPQRIKLPQQPSVTHVYTAQGGRRSVGRRAMRCTACGAELILTKVIPDDMVRGFEHHSFIWSACHITEHRLLFTRHGREDDTEPVPVRPSPSRVAPGSTVQSEQLAARGLFSRMFAKMRGY